MAWIYILTFPNGKQYVGQTINLKKRYSDYRSNNVNNRPIHNAIRKYGWGNIKKVEMNCSEEYLDWMEQEWIKTLNCICPNGYNIVDGGNSNKHYNKELKKRLSEMKIGEKNPMFGKHWDINDPRRVQLIERNKSNHYILSQMNE